MKNINKYMPNIISAARIVLSVILLGVLKNPVAFGVIYVSIGISDVLDGYIARRYGYVSNLGARLDSLSDMVFYLILVYIFYMMYPWALADSSRYILTIMVIRLTNILLTKLKYKRVVLLHTIGNKASGLIVYLMPILLRITTNSIIIKSLLTLIILAALEELCITLTVKEPQLNRRNIFKE